MRSAPKKCPFIDQLHTSNINLSYNVVNMMPDKSMCGSANLDPPPLQKLCYIVTDLRGEHTTSFPLIGGGIILPIYGAFFMTSCSNNAQSPTVGTSNKGDSGHIKISCLPKGKEVRVPTLSSLKGDILLFSSWRKFHPLNNIPFCT